MKKIIVVIQTLLIAFITSANNSISINDKCVVHLLCPAAVSYVQVGNADLLIAEAVESYPNLVRIKALDRFTDTTSLTIVCQDKLYAFEVIYDQKSTLKLKLADFQGENLSELNQSSLPIHKIKTCIKQMQITEHKSSIRKAKVDNIEMSLESIKVKHDLLFLRLKVKNNSNLIYRAEYPHFLMRDKRPKKAANVQEYLLEPVEVSCQELFITPQDEKVIVLVFKSFSIPKYKEVEITLREKTIGYTGRDLALRFNNKAIVRAGHL